MIEFPSGAALQIEKDRMRKKGKKNEGVAHELLGLAYAYIRLNNITGEPVLGTSAVTHTAVDFVQEVCELVGYKEAPDAPISA